MALRLGAVICCSCLSLLHEGGNGRVETKITLIYLAILPRRKIYNLTSKDEIGPMYV